MNIICIYNYKFIDLNYISILKTTENGGIII